MPSDHAAARTRARNLSWKRVSPETSGWKDVPSRLPCSTATTPIPGSAASVVARGPTSVTSGCADEGRLHRSAVESLDRDLGLERVDLAAEGVAGYDDVEAAEGLLTVDRAGDAVGEHDQPRARAVHRHPRGDRRPDRRLHVERASELVDDARFTARDHEAVDGRQLGRSPHQGDFGAESAQDLRRARARLPGGRGCRRVRASTCSVLDYQPRSARRWGAARSVTLMPTIASPRPRDTSAMTLASS